jgi:hypothetical protein
MNRIIYEKGIFGFECTKLEICRNEKKGAVELCFTENIKGILRLGKHSRIIDGESCIFDTGEELSGIFEPILESRHGREALEGFRIENGKAVLLQKNGEYIRRLADAVKKLDEKVRVMEERLSQTEKEIKGNPIF